MSPLRFCLVTTFYPPYNFGGDGVFVHRLAHALAGDGHRVDVVHDVDAFLALAGREPTADYPGHPNITVHSLRGGRRARLDLIASHQIGAPAAKRAELRRILDQDGIDVIHFHNISLMGGPGILSYGGAAKVCTLHDYWFVCSMHVLWRFDREACTRRTCLRCTLAGRRPPQWWRYTGATARAARHVGAFIAGSRFSQRTHAANGFPEPVHYLPHFLPEPGKPEPGKPAPAPHPRPYFLYVGRLETLKGPQTLVDRFREYREADLILVGNGTLEKELRAAAADLPHVHFLGWVEHHRLRTLYENAIAVLVPSLCYETFGLVIIEAFASGTPAIARNFGALPEIVEGSGAGYLYSSSEQLIEAMETLRGFPERRAEMGQRARRRYLEEYTEAGHLERYYRLIDGVK